MKHKTNNVLRAMAKHFGLKPRFVDYLPDTVHGRLLVREKRILINARKPRYEHIFTLLHELGHFVIHVKKQYRAQDHWMLRRNFNIPLLDTIVSRIRRHFRMMFHKESGQEWEADLWAMCAFMLVAKTCGCQQELKTFANHHPEKLSLMILAALAVAYAGMKTRFQKFSRQVLLPFGLI